MKKKCDNERPDPKVMTPKSRYKAKSVKWLRFFTMILLTAFSAKTWAVCDSELETLLAWGTTYWNASSKKTALDIHRGAIANGYYLNNDIKKLNEQIQLLSKWLNDTDGISPLHAKYRICMSRWSITSIQNKEASKSSSLTEPSNSNKASDLASSNTNQSQQNQPSGPMENCNALFTPERLKSLPGPQYVQEHIDCLNRNLARSKAQVTTASTTPTSQEAQQQAQQTQQLAAQNQTRADQARQGKRKTHEPAAEAHECIAIDNAGSGNFGAFKNTCSYRVNFYTCNYKPRVTQGGFNWSADFDCEKQQHGMHTPGAGVSVAAHNRNTETVHWFACKAPASPVDVSFVQGQGLSGRCN